MLKEDSVFENIPGLPDISLAKEKPGGWEPKIPLGNGLLKNN